MSLYDQKPQTTEQDATNRAARALLFPRNVLKTALEEYRSFFTLVFNSTNATASQVLAAMGTCGREAFQRHEALGKFMESEHPGCTKVQEANFAKPVVFAEDGTASLKT
jgi:hypothetical protein